MCVNVFIRHPPHSSRAHSMEPIGRSFRKAEVMTAALEVSLSKPEDTVHTVMKETKQTAFFRWISRTPDSAAELKVS